MVLRENGTKSEEKGTDKKEERSGPTKHDVISFVRGAQGNPEYRKSFVDGEWWSDEAEFDPTYVEEEWTDEDGFVTKKGAALINYADSIYDEDDGFDLVLAVLNDVGAEAFIEESVKLHKEGEFEEGNESGFTGTGSFTDTDGGFF